MCNLHMSIFVISNQIFPIKFSPHFRKKTFWWAWRENTQTPPLFSPLPIPTKHLPKILPKIYFTKHNLNKGNQETDFLLFVFH